MGGGFSGELRRTQKNLRKISELSQDFLRACFYSPGTEPTELQAKGQDGAAPHATTATRKSPHICPLRVCRALSREQRCRTRSGRGPSGTCGVGTEYTFRFFRGAADVHSADAHSAKGKEVMTFA